MRPEKVESVEAEVQEDLKNKKNKNGCLSNPVDE